MDITSLLSSTPVTFNGLQKASGLSATGLALALVELGGKVAVQDGGLSSPRSRSRPPRPRPVPVAPRPRSPPGSRPAGPSS